MLTKAVSKLQTEIDANKNNSYINVVGQFLLNHLESNPASAEKIMSQDKTIAKSLTEMQRAAQSKKVNNVAVLTDQEGFDIVLKYFGIDTVVGIDLAAGPDYSVINNTVIPNPNYSKKEPEFDIKLEDLL